MRYYKQRNKGSTMRLQLLNRMIFMMLMVSCANAETLNGPFLSAGKALKPVETNKPQLVVTRKLRRSRNNKSSKSSSSGSSRRSSSSSKSSSSRKGSSKSNRSSKSRSKSNSSRKSSSKSNRSSKSSASSKSSSKISYSSKSSSKNSSRKSSKSSSSNFVYPSSSPTHEPSITRTTQPTVRTYAPTVFKSYPTGAPLNVRPTAIPKGNVPTLTPIITLIPTKVPVKTLSPENESLVTSSPNVNPNASPTSRAPTSPRPVSNPTIIPITSRPTIPTEGSCQVSNGFIGSETNNQGTMEYFYKMEYEPASDANEIISNLELAITEVIVENTSVFGCSTNMSRYLNDMSDGEIVGISSKPPDLKLDSDCGNNCVIVEGRLSIYIASSPTRRLNTRDEVTSMFLALENAMDNGDLLATNEDIISLSYLHPNDPALIVEDNDDEGVVNLSENENDTRAGNELPLYGIGMIISASTVVLVVMAFYIQRRRRTRGKDEDDDEDSDHEPLSPSRRDVDERASIDIDEEAP